MKILTLSVITFMGSCAYCADLTPRDIVARSISNYDKDWAAALDFTYTEHEVSKDDAGRAKTSEVSQVTVLEGTPYSRVIGKNGHTLTAEEARREEEKYQKALDLREKESPAQRAHRLRKYKEERAFLHEIPDAFDVRLLGHETINGRSNYVMQLTPKPGYVPRSKNARIFADIQGKLWIDEQDIRWTQAEANVTDTISFGWVLARIGPGAHIKMKQVKVDGEHWMPKEIDVTGTARIMLVKNRNLDEKVSYSDYKRVRSPAGTAAARNNASSQPVR